MIGTFMSKFLHSPGAPAGDENPASILIISLLSVFIGVLTGLGAVMFHGMIAIFINLMFLGKFSFAYDANVYLPTSAWGPLVILVPVVGAVGVSFLVKNFAPEAKGSGVPDVIHAIYHKQGVIRPVVSVIKLTASSLTLGSGGSVGREGPIAQVGASFSSAVAQRLKIPAWQRITLVTAGAGGGIAAAFNAPIGGMLFAAEILLHEINVRTIIPIALCTATATYISRLFLGSHYTFVMSFPENIFYHMINPLLLVSYAGLGVLMGVASALYIKFLYGFEEVFNKWIGGSYYRKHMTGMFLVGVLIYLSKTAFGHYSAGGLGYATIQDILSGTLMSFRLLLILFALKLITTSLSLGSGAAGGIFSPALFMGATLGSAFGMVMQGLLPLPGINHTTFAVAGMAGMVGGATGAVLAAVVMISEMTFDYGAIIPMIITVALSYGIRRVFVKESIYTLRLVRQGHYIPSQLQTDLYRFERAKDVMETRFETVRASLTADEFRGIVMQKNDIVWFLLEESGNLTGVVHRDDLFLIHDVPGNQGVNKTAQRRYIVVSDEITVLDVIVRLQEQQASVALVTSAEGDMSARSVKGLISKQEIGNAMTRSIELTSLP